MWRWMWNTPANIATARRMPGRIRSCWSSRSREKQPIRLPHSAKPATGLPAAVAISNAADSTILREASASLRTFAGIEKAVPATKSFTAQLTILYLFTLFMARKRGPKTSEVIRTHVKQRSEIADGIELSLGKSDEQAAGCARSYQHAKSFLFLGLGVHDAIAREGALKLKEISYIQAEGLPARELRHGPKALVDDKFSVVVLTTRDSSDPDSILRYHKTLTVLEYVKGRGGKAIAIAKEGDREISALADRVIHVPHRPELLLPILEVVPPQLFAYRFAVLNGADVDHPRNLVKAVIAE